MDWFAEWGSEWQEDGIGGEGVSTDVRMFGKSIGAYGLLFLNSCTRMNAVFIQRDAQDDFARMEIPDTRCPPLDIELSLIGNSAAQRSERYRWSWSGDVQFNKGWRIWESTGIVQLNHTVYPGDFVVQFNFGAIKKSGSYLRSGNARSFDGVCVVINHGGRLYIAGAGWMEHYQPRQEWQNRYAGRAYLMLVTAGGPTPLYLEMVPVPDSQHETAIRIERQVTNLRFHWLSSSDAFVATDWFPSQEGPVSIRLEGVQVHV